MTQPDNEYIAETKHMLANCLYVLPWAMAFLACMLALGGFDLDLLGLGCIVAAALLYGPCNWLADRMWEQEP